MEYFLEHPAHLWYLIAGISFVIELSVMGLSGPLLFFAIASLTTGILTSVGVINSWQSEIFTVGLLTLIVAVILWKPLKSLQNTKEKTDSSSDMIGLTVFSSSDINMSSGTIRYSGVDWQARLSDKDQTIPENSQCKIVAIVGTVMMVEIL